ncbi:hypothetical protein [Cerasicoccus frondis]|uniref:hypothetical protein n=1 Tax=Cerasicoccus frondis TaxID=490090 RepID=UPI002852B59C|nr:hypothetical protein [Cerasicoccus frondis]
MNNQYFKIFACCLPVALVAELPVNWPSQYPEWWYSANTAESVIDESQLGSDAGNYSPLLLGQLKHIAVQAREELEVELVSIGGAGVDIDSLVLPWLSNPTAGDNFAVVNLGQLKNVAHLYYEKFAEIGFDPDAAGWIYAADGITPLPLSAPSALVGADPLIMVYPWETNSSDDNLGIVLVGQAKSLFSWSLRTWTTLDEDADGLPDWWEQYYFATLAKNGGADDDGDGVTNLVEYWFGSNPLDGTDLPDGVDPSALSSSGDHDNDTVANSIDADPFDATVGALAIVIDSVSLN